MAAGAMRFGWLGFHMEGLPALQGVLEAGYRPEAVITLREDKARSRSGVVDYAPLCERYGVPLYPVASINDEEAVGLLERLALDVLIVLGWSQIVRPPAMRRVRRGLIGAHASLLPHNRGSAPINWALIHGETRSGNTLMWLSEGVDSGAIIDQVAFPITPYDTCATLYEKVAATNREMILRLLPRLTAGPVPGRPQPASEEPLLPRRRPADGLVDWRRPARQVYDFVRALTRPYPGAFSFLENQRWTIWQSALLPAGSPAEGPPGRVIGPVVSPQPGACGQVVRCGDGCVVLLELTSDDGAHLHGPALAEQQWTGKVWGDG